VTDLTALREAAGHVIGIFRALEIFKVTRYAGRHRDVVVVIDVAAGTWSGHVETRQRPARRRVIKLTVRP